MPQGLGSAGSVGWFWSKIPTAASTVDFYLTEYTYGLQRLVALPLGGFLPLLPLEFPPCLAEDVLRPFF